LLKQLFMKKIFTILSLLGSVAAFTQPLLSDDFNYSGLITSNGWSSHNGTLGQLSTTAGLSYPGYTGSGIGNAVAVLAGTSGTGGVSEDANREISPAISGNGAVVWMTFLSIWETEPQPHLFHSFAQDFM
jgi:hypothetical protein